MFRSSKSKIEKGKEKVDFKLEFDASRVPQRGWDKLLVSLIHWETGKVTARTAKASTRNGSCHWEEPLYECVRSPLDTKTTDPNKGLYKIVVATGSNRSGILGETIINLEEYIGVNVPTSLALPLQNCNTDTLLHVRIECLTPKASLRDFEGPQEVSPKPDLQSPISEVGPDLNKESSGNRIPNNGQVPEPDRPLKFSISTTDGTCAPLVPWCSSESVEIPSTPGGSEVEGNARCFPSRDPSPSSSASSCTAGRQESVGLNDYKESNGAGNCQDSNRVMYPPGAYPKPPKLGGTSSYSPAHTLKLLHDPHPRQMEQPSPAGTIKLNAQGNFSTQNIPLTSEKGVTRPVLTGHGSGSSMYTDVEAAETIIKELREAAANWERNARTLGAEVEKLKQKLATETRNCKEVGMELCALTAERDSIKLEVDQIKFRKKACEERETGQEKLWLEVQNARSIIRELQDELHYEKTMNLNFNVQLQKTQESNSELLLEIQDLEEALNKKNQEMNDINLKVYSTEEMEQGETLEDAKASWIQKIQASEEEIRKLGEELVNLQLSDNNGAKSPDEKLRKMVVTLKNELDELEKDSHELTEENIDLLSKLKQANDKLIEKEELIAQLRDMMNDLKEKLRSSEEFSQSQLASSRTVLDDLNSSAMVIRSKNAHLELQLKCSDEEISSLKREVDSLKLEMDGHEKERSLFASQKGQLKALREKAAKGAQDYALVLKRAEILEGKNATLEEEADQAISALRKQLEDSEGKATNAMQLMESLEADIRQLSEQNSLLLSEKEALEVSVFDLEKSNKTLQERVQEAEKNSAESLSQVHGCAMDVAKLHEQVIASEAQVKYMEDKLSELQKIREESEKRVQDTHEENSIYSSRIKELEFQLSVLEEDVHSMNESRSMLETKAQGMQKQNDELRDKFKAAQEDCRTASEHANTLVEEIRGLKFEMGSHIRTKISMESSLTDLESQKSLLQSQVESLEEENLQLKETINKLEFQFKDILEERESARFSLRDMENEKLELEVSLQKLIKKQQDTIIQLQNDKSEVIKEAENYRRVIQDLEMCIENMKQEVASNSPFHTKLDEQPQKVTDDCSDPDLKVTLRSDGGIERRLLEAIQTLLATQEQLQMSADDAEDTLGTSSLEKQSAVEKLQKEIRWLTEHVSNNFDNEEKPIPQALSEVSQLQAEKKDLEEKLLSMQEIIQQANADAFSVKQSLDLEIEGSRRKEVEMKEKLDMALKEVDELKKVEKDCRQKIAVLEQKYVSLKEEKYKHVEERDEIICKMRDYGYLQTELGNSRNALHDLRLEKIKIESSLTRSRLENSRITEELKIFKEKARVNEEVINKLKQAKSGLEEKVLHFHELMAKGSRKIPENELKSELMRLRKQSSEFKRKLSAVEEEREESKRKILSLEEQLQHKSGALAMSEKRIKEKEESSKISNGDSHVSIARSLSKANGKVVPMSGMSQSRDSKEVANLREKVELLEYEVKTKEFEAEAMKHRFQETESELCNKIGHLELVNGRLLEERSNSKLHNWQEEMNRLQNQNAALCQRENELLSRLHLNEATQKEMERLKEEKGHLNNLLLKFNEVAKGGDILERVSFLESKLEEALEANNLYKSQLESMVAKQQHVRAAALKSVGNVDQVIKDLAELKRKNLSLEEELKEMRDRYSHMSLQFAEVEAEREELVMTIRTLRNGNKNLAPERSEAI